MSSISAGQRALSVGDVLLTIVEQVVPNNAVETLRHGHRRFLLRIGLLCKATWSILQPLIWRSVTSQMITCQIPRTIRRPAMDTSAITATSAEAGLHERPIIEDIVDTLARYCIHTQVLDLYDWKDYLVLALVLLQELGARFRASSVKPCVTRICVMNEDAGTDALFAVGLQPFMGPQLQSIELSLGAHKESPRMLFEAIGAHCTGLRHFTLDCSETNDWGTMTETLTRTVIQSCVLLETIKMDIVHNRPSLWTALARLDKLKTIEFTTSRMYPMNLVFPAEVNAPQAFNSLQELSVREFLDRYVQDACLRPGDKSLVNVPAAFAPLRKLGLLCIGGSEVCALASVIVERWESSLEQLDLFLKWGHWESAPLTFGQVIERLHLLRRLRGLGIHDIYPFDLADSDIIRLTTAWPNLERLQFSCPETRYEPRAQGNLHLSRRSIHIIAEAYPNLKALAIPINYTLPFTELPPDAVVPTCPHVRLWDCADSFFGPDTRENLREVGRFMRRYLPSVRDFWGVRCYTQWERRKVIVRALRASGEGSSGNPHYISWSAWDGIYNPDPPDPEDEPSDPPTGEEEDADEDSE